MNEQPNKQIPEVRAKSAPSWDLTGTGAELSNSDAFYKQWNIGS